MIIYKFALYTLLLSYNPCDVFTYYNVTEMHGLNLADCKAYNNTSQDAYFAGWCNYIPNLNSKYKKTDPKFVFINLNRCNSDVETFSLVMHELMHQSFDIHKNKINKEEEIISWAEKESHIIVKIIKTHNLKLMKQKITESLTTNDTLDGQFITKPKALAQTNGYSISFLNENSRLARRIKAGKTNSKKYKHITL